MVLYIIGFLSGIISGMGIGGGAILIPALVLFVHPEQHVAQSVNLIFFIPTAIIALIVHLKNKNIQFKMAIPIIIIGFVGSYIGSKLAISMSEVTLRKWFGIFLLLMGVYNFFSKSSFLSKNITEQ